MLLALAKGMKCFGRRLGAFGASYRHEVEMAWLTLPAHSQLWPHCSCLASEALERGIADGVLEGSVECPVVAAHMPSRAVLLAAMKQRSISLPSFDVVTDRSGAAVPVERFWQELCGAGGPSMVG